MAERAALLIAVESFLEAGPPLSYAAADAAELLRTLPAAGYDAKKCLLLTGPRTTKAILESHLTRLPALLGKPDSLLVLVASRGFSKKNHGFIACTDTLLPDLTGTALSIADLFESVQRTLCAEVTVLLDLDPLTLPGELAPSGINEQELAKLCDTSPSCACLLACAPGERSFESAPLRHGIWRHHLIEAFSGKSRIGVNTNGTLTAGGLYESLLDAVPRTLRRAYETQQEQTPLLFGTSHAENTLAELGSLLSPPGELLDPTRMKRVVFRSETPARIRDLAGFRKSHSLPERANEWARKYVNRIAQPDLKADLDSTFEMLREAFSYKRKDLDVSTERDGVGFIRTPDFEYTVMIEVNPADPTEVVWRREVGRLVSPDVVRSEAFASVFGDSFATLAFEFAVPVDVAAFVDRLEDSPLDGVSVSVASDSDAAEVKLAGFTGLIRVTPHAVDITGRTASSVGLLDHFLTFLQKFSGLGEMRALSP